MTGRRRVRHRRRSAAVGLLAGVLADRLVGDPRRGHPVAAFGQVAGALERLTYRDSRAAGVVFTATAVGGLVAAAAYADRRVTGAGVRVPFVALATWSVLGGESLGREARAVAAQLSRGDLPAARRQVTHLVGRDPTHLDTDEVARAALESVAENSSDAVVAPLLWGAVFGVPGLVGYRAVNTLDAMVGYRSPRYRKFGWAAARLDDVANLLPARLTAVLVAATSGRPGATWQAVRRDARRHPSPNAGWCEAAFAGALDVRLGGTNVYAGRIEHRPQLGDGRPVHPGDLGRAVTLLRRVTLAAAAVAAGLAAVRPRDR